MSRYKGKLAIVTGSAVGIGAGIVERLLKGGLKVWTFNTYFAYLISGGTLGYLSFVNI